MALLDVFKKKEEKKETPKPAPKKEVVKEVKKKETPAVKKTVRPKAKGLAFNVLKSPHVTEKASDLTSKNQYVFNVWPKVNKLQIKKAVEDLYGVDVTAVRIINIHKKARRVGKSQGFKKGYKKAIVSLKQGQKIEILPR